MMEARSGSWLQSFFDEEGPGLKGVFKNQGYSLFWVVFLSLWLKTYIAYKTSFEIDIENWIQEFILLINPVSFLLLTLGMNIFLKENRRKVYLLTMSFFITLVLFANLVFYRFFNDFLTIPVLFQTSNMSDLGSSVQDLINPSDLLYFADLLFLMFLTIYKPKTFHVRSYNLQNRKFFISMALGVTFFNLALAEAERPELLTRTFDREILVKNIGTYNYHLYDAILQTKSSAQRALADGSELSEIENYVRSNQKKVNDDLYGLAKGKNVIFVSLESTQSFVINKTVNGEEITPFLNEFIKDSYYFNNFYHQTGQGKTSDSEFIIENSLYPLGRGAVFFTHAQNEYKATPEILTENGYYTASLHANNKSFWNRDMMYDSLGYQRFFNSDDYEVSEKNSVNWGLNDKSFFQQSIAHLEGMPQPFYAKFITLTNHFPFTLNEEDRTLEPYDSNSKTLNQYFPTVRYTDEALERFIADLKRVGLYEKSIIVMYGDHYGISENHNSAMSQFLGKEITPFESVQLQRVPLIIHVPGQKGKTISTVSGQIDVRPTLMHLLGIKTDDFIEFGKDLFSEETIEFTVLRDSSFITKDYLYTMDTCYDKKTGAMTERDPCENYLEKAKQELEYSDKIIYGDLLRFYEKKKMKKERNLAQFSF
ncbi:Lipoteichoic acid synthase 2 [Peribacillus sp. Bi96]|uniref:LTA synthase family protein n=1 Tax=Peribacillus sp. Bi96 TaxID=2884273 RepID=UPI001DD4E435|nr:LTA synthase family protein [Peribacillus sp. Bi96]CAH0176068.1 Lipoteichoic acid synthase 2 [Peribacillus sp. Bi96]